MNATAAYFRDLVSSSVAGWNRFWFTPTDPATLGLVRILGGAMMFYTHAVWSLGLIDFFGPQGWLAPSAVAAMPASRFNWSHLWLVESPAALWAVHAAALAVFAMLTVGLALRIVAPLAWLLTVSYAHRATGALFGLDQINALLAMYLMVGYLMIGPSGATYSLDRYLAARRRGQPLGPVSPSIGANIAVRLIQLHMCVIYLFAGMAKLKGVAWWDGSAMWGAVGNLEYQSIDITALANWPVLVAVLTHVTVYWELSYAALVWPRLTRPIVIVLAVPLHLGIAVFLGMITFGLAMLIGNLAFVSPAVVRGVVEWPRRRSRSTGDVQPPATVRAGGSPRRRESSRPATEGAARR